MLSTSSACSSKLAVDLAGRKGAGTAPACIADQSTPARKGWARTSDAPPAPSRASALECRRDVTNFRPAGEAVAQGAPDRMPDSDARRGLSSSYSLAAYGEGRLARLTALRRLAPTFFMTSGVAPRSSVSCLILLFSFDKGESDNKKTDY